MALAALHHFLDAPSIDRLRQVLGLTSSGAVRLVDRLQGAGVVRRRAGSGRADDDRVATPSGRRAAASVASARAACATPWTPVAGRARPAGGPTSRVVVGLMREPGGDPVDVPPCDTGVWA